MSAGNELFDAVTRDCGLAKIFAARVITNALKRANAAPPSLTTTELSRALPFIEDSLRTFLNANEVSAALTRLRALAR